MSYRIFDGYMSPRQGDGYVHLSNANTPIYTFDGYNFGFFTSSDFVYDSAKGIIYLPNRTTAPSSTPSGGGWFYSEGGDTYWFNSNGAIQSLSPTRISRSIPSDANYTAVQSDYQAKIMEFTSSVSLTATRNVVLPLVSGYQWLVYNNTTGGQSLQFIGSSGSGAIVANGSRAVIYCDGSNIQVLSSGAPSGTAIGIYGNGHDGTATADGSATVAGMTRVGSVYTMSRDVYFVNLTVNNGVTIKTNGFRIFVNNILTNNGSINADGGNGVTNSGVGGLGGGQNTGNAQQPVSRLGNGAQGAYGGASIATWTQSYGGAGGSSTFGGPYGVTPPDAWAGGVYDLLSAINGAGTGADGNASLSSEVFFGGNGGAGTAEGGSTGAGGGGGGVVVVAAYTLAGSGSISANGGNGSSSTTYSAAGGGGGLVVLVTRFQTSWTGTLTANGGAHGPTGTGGTAGSAGTVVTFTA